MSGSIGVHACSGRTVMVAVERTLKGLDLTRLRHLQATKLTVS